MFYFSLIKTSLRAAINKRTAFLIESVLMIANNLIFFMIWWIFFRQFNDIDGWTLHDMVALMAVVTGGYGLTHIFFGGTKNLSHMIVSGDLDPFMTQPKNLLLHVVGSRSNPKGWGNVATALILVILGGIATTWALPVILISMVCSCMVFFSVQVIAHSLPFWMGSLGFLSKKYCDSVYLFSIYPTNIYSGLLQLLMFTVIPAGVISYLPVELVRNFSWLKLSVLILSTASFVAIAFGVFYAGLKRYESGNQFGTRL